VTDFFWAIIAMGIAFSLVLNLYPKGNVNLTVRYAAGLGKRSRCTGFFFGYALPCPAMQYFSIFKVD